MKAIVYTQYGSPDGMELKEVGKPTPKDDEVLIQVQAASVNAADLHMLRGEPALARLSAGLRRPKRQILGADVAGRVEAAGKDVTQFQRGDEVFGGISGCGWGGFAEFVCARANVLVTKSVNLTFAAAASVPMAAVTALQGLRDKGQIQPGQKVLINGASGGVGTFAVQIARSFGAEVTAVCSTRNLEMVRSIGADHVIDYTQADFTQNGQQYDLILAVNGFHSLSDYKRALAPQGVYVMSGGEMAQMMQAMFMGPLHSMGGSRKIRTLLAQPSRTDLAFVCGLLETGAVAPVIDRTFPLSEVPAALRYLEEVHARGKVTIAL